MARSLRLSFENGVYHIMARGIRKEKIYCSNKDKFAFINKMNETFNKYSFICYAFCLMDNHYHLFVKTPLANLSEGMHYLNTSYATWFKAKYQITGGLFQGRYKSVIVDADSYALVLSSYIHVNPLKARMVQKLEDYAFNSYLDYIGARKPIIKNFDAGFILNRLANDKNIAIDKYIHFISEHKDMKNPLDNEYKSFALGDDEFV